MSQAFVYERVKKSSRLRHVSLVAIGGNVASSFGSPAETVRAAMTAVKTDSVEVAAASRLYSTPCFPSGTGPDYINAAMILSTSLSPQALLAHLHAVESRFGRERVQRWGMRTLDLDLLAYDNLVSPDSATFNAWHDLSVEQQKLRAPDELILPHPRLHERAFVLIPLAEIAPDWRHPVLGETISALLTRLPPDDCAEVHAV